MANQTRIIAAFVVVLIIIVAVAFVATRKSQAPTNVTTYSTTVVQSTLQPSSTIKPTTTVQQVNQSGGNKTEQAKGLAPYLNSSPSEDYNLTSNQSISAINTS